MTDAIIQALIPEPTDEEQQLAHDYLLEHTSWPFGYEGKPASKAELAKWFAAHRVAAARTAIEWAAEKANISDMINGGAAGEYIYTLLATHDAAVAIQNDGTEKPMASDENIETLRSLPGAEMVHMPGRTIARIIARLDFEIAQRKTEGEDNRRDYLQLRDDCDKALKNAADLQLELAAERKKAEHERDLERRALRVVIEMEDLESGTEGDFMRFAAYGDLYDEVRAIRAALMRETESRDSRDAN